jgi:hypothetical protein
MTRRWRPVWLQLLRRRKCGGGAVSTSTAGGGGTSIIDVGIRKVVHAGGCRQAVNRVARHWQKVIGSA